MSESVEHRVSALRVLLGALVTWFVIVDLLRKMVDGAVWLLIVSDCLALLLFALFYHRRVYRAHVKASMPRGLTVLLVCYCFVVVTQAFNPAIPSPVLSAAGLRTYLLYVPAIGIGLVLLRSPMDVLKIHRFLLVLAAGTIVLALYQAWVGAANLGPLLQPMDHKVHSIGAFTYDLIPATFASSRRFGRFLILVYPLVYASAVYLEYTRRYRLAIVGLFFAGAVASGSKEVLVLFVLFHVFFWWATTRQQLNKPLIIGGAVAAVLIAWFTIFDYRFDDITEANYRIKALVTSREDWAFRVNIYLLRPWTDLNTEYAVRELFTGTGVGTYGSETSMLGAPEDVRLLGINRSSGGDAGMSKLIVELGVFGFILVTVLWIAVLRHMWHRVQAIRHTSFHPFAVGLFFVPFSWAVLVVKAHTTISDGMMSFGLWVSVGALLALTPPPPEPAPAESPEPVHPDLLGTVSV